MLTAFAVAVRTILTDRFGRSHDCLPVYSRRANFSRFSASVKNTALTCECTDGCIIMYNYCNIRKLLYQALILPHLDYCSVVWSSCGITLSKRIARVQNYAMRIILRKPPLTSSLELRQSLGWISLRERRHCALLCQVHGCCSKQASPYLCSKFVLNSERQNYANTRGVVNLHLGRPKTNFFHNSFEFQGALHYNSLPSTIRGITSRSAFKKALLKYISSN